jgi:hypothetical protein
VTDNTPPENSAPDLPPVPPEVAAPGLLSGPPSDASSPATTMIPASSPAPAAAGPAVEPLPQERALRGLLFTLPVIPVGFIAWVLLWQLGFIASIVAFGVAMATVFLYRKGSGGRVGPAGLGVIAAVTLVTLALSFLGGMAYDLAQFMSLPFPGALVDGEFWDTFWLNVFGNGDLWAQYLPDLLFALLFAVLGTFSVFRRLAREARRSR